MDQNEGTGAEKEKRRSVHFEKQKALLSSGDYSDVKITCGAKTWNIHKAIICPSSGFFARAVKFGKGRTKEQNEPLIDLPQDDPKIIKLALDYLYTLYYDPHEGETNEANVVCLSLVWSEHDILSRAERRKLQEGLYLMNYRAMEKAMLVTNETFPDLKPHESYWFYVLSSKITKEYMAAIFEILDDPNFTEGEKFYDLDYEDCALTNAKLYCIGNNYVIPGLQELSLSHITESLARRSLDDGMVTRALQVLLDNTPEVDEEVRMLVTHELYKDMDWFGIRPCNRDFFERYPKVHERYLKHRFGGDCGASK